jgi:hypothetical protein
MPAMRIVVTAFLLVCFSPALLASETTVPKWLIGTWTPISDEDGTPPDFADFTADGKYINHGFDCSIRTEMLFHIHGGDVYITYEVPGKGPIALVFRPSKDKKQLTYTSPRTRRNAVLAQTGKKCG